MPLWRRLAIVGVLVFVVSTAAWALRPWTSAVSLPPVANKTPQAVFECGAPLGPARVHPPTEAARGGNPLPRQPCTTRGERRSLAILDLGLGTVALVILVTVRRSRPAEEVNGTT